MQKHSETTHSPHLLYIRVFTLLRVEPTISTLIGMTLEKSFRPPFECQPHAGRRVARRALSVVCGSSLGVRCSGTWQSLCCSGARPPAIFTDLSATLSPCKPQGETFQAQKSTFLLS